MKELFEQLLESAMSTHSAIISLKKLAIKCGQYELASELRKLELKKFPETKEVKLAKKQAVEWNTLFRMVNLNMNPEIAYLIVETLKKHKRTQGNFSIEDAAKLISKNQELFIKK